MNGQIEIYEPNSDAAKSIAINSKDEPFVRKVLSQKFKDLEGF
jgi:hypothetical protein